MTIKSNHFLPNLAFLQISTWLFVVSPLPARFFWPVVVLPALVASFLAEASKFLFYDTSVCRKTVWFPPGTESLPQIAQCSLGVTGIYGIASGIIFLICLVLVCLKAPNRRDLEPNYGLDFESGNIDIINTGSFYGKERSIQFVYQPNGRDAYSTHHINRPQVDEPGFYPSQQDEKSGVTSMNPRGHESRYESSIVAKSNLQRDVEYDEDDLVSEQRSNNADRKGDGDNQDSDNPLKPPTTDVTIIRNRSGGNSFAVSQSRLETVEKMEKDASNLNRRSAQMIDELLDDLDKSFQTDGGQNEI